VTTIIPYHRNEELGPNKGFLAFSVGDRFVVLADAFDSKGIIIPANTLLIVTDGGDGNYWLEAADSNGCSFTFKQSSNLLWGYVED
jgi:hypothetical protein